MSNKSLKEQCFITLVMVIIMGAVLLSTYEGPPVSADAEAGVLYGSAGAAGLQEGSANDGAADLQQGGAGDDSTGSGFSSDGSAAGSSSSRDGSEAGTAANEYEGIIRLHVIANSDSETDQDLKLKVRDEIISQVGDLNRKASIEESREWLKSQLDDLEKAAESVIRENGCNYSASAELGVRWIPEKSYGDMYFPAGNYEALTITLGKGEGENWWCVLFPPLCLITEDEAELEEMGLDSQDQIRVKSWLAEVLDGSSRK